MSPSKAPARRSACLRLCSLCETCVSHRFLSRNLPAAPPPADYGGHDSLFHSNAIYTTNGWNCEERGALHGRARALHMRNAPSDGLRARALACAERVRTAETTLTYLCPRLPPRRASHQRGGLHPGPRGPHLRQRLRAHDVSARARECVRGRCPLLAQRVLDPPPFPSPSPLPSRRFPCSQEHVDSLFDNCREQLPVVPIRGWNNRERARSHYARACALSFAHPPSLLPALPPARPHARQASTRRSATRRRSATAAARSRSPSSRPWHP